MNAVLMYLCGIAIGVALGISYQASHEKPAAPPVDWDKVTTCTWERWDSGADMSRVLRFCFEVYPKVTP